MNFYKKNLLFFCLFSSFLTAELFAAGAAPGKRKAEEAVSEVKDRFIWNAETREQLLEHFQTINDFQKAQRKACRKRRKAQSRDVLAAIRFDWKGLEGLIPEELFSYLKKYGFEKNVPGTSLGRGGKMKIGFFLTLVRESLSQKKEA